MLMGAPTNNMPLIAMAEIIFFISFLLKLFNYVLFYLKSTHIQILALSGLRTYLF
jgi:hypothetical protein